MIFLLLACTPDRLKGDEGVIDSAAYVEDPVEIVPGVEVDDSAGRIFQLDMVHQIELTLSEESITSLWADPYTHVEALLTFDGKALESPIGARNKGRYGSYRDLDHKSGFKLDLNRYNGDQNLFGLEHLNVNNMIQDNSQVHDLTAYAAYHAAGVNAPRVGYAWLKVNGVDYGLYLMVEDYDEHFLEVRFDDPSGNLYDGDYWLAPDWSYYILLDFSDDRDDYYTLQEGESVAMADIYSITHAVDEACGSGNFYVEMDKVVDMDHYLREWAVEMWVGQYDGYAYNSNNYRIYFNPQDDRAVIMPWDHDWAFYSSTPITTPYGRLASCCMADLICWEEMKQIIDEVCDRIDEAPIEGEVQTALDLIGPYMEADPRREQTLSTFEYYQQELRYWLRGRSDTLRQTFGI